MSSMHHAGRPGTDPAAAGHAAPVTATAVHAHLTDQSRGAVARRAVGLAVALTTLLTVVVIAFAWPNANLAPRGVPVAVVGPPPAVAQVSAQLTQGGFDVRTLPSEAAAREVIQGRDVYGAVVLAPPAPHVLTASAASPAVAAGLAELAAHLGGQGPSVVDVVPAPAADPHGAGLAGATLPIVLAGIVAAGALTRLLPRPGARAATALGYAVAGALAVTAVVQLWLGSLTGPFWGNAGVLALTVAAVALPLLGLAAVLGLPGLGVGAAVMLLLGNPLSAVTSAPELLPSGWGTLGQLLPPGAGVTALRSVAFFDGAGAGEALTVLTTYVVLGLALLALAALRARRQGSSSDLIARRSSIAS